MSHKNWTFTAYEDGEVVAVERYLNNEQALVALRTAIYGEPAPKTAVEPESQVADAVEPELARVA
jgi:hypothetical protein